jgi:uncharacterized protein involved in exopolysaccharide biosynthesis
MTTSNKSGNDDFLDLADILRVIWKWKFIILAGTLVFVVIIAVISINAKKVYRVEMTIRPGNLSISEKGKIIYIDSSANISAMINTGTFDGKILDYLKNDSLHNLPNSFRFETYIPKGSETIKIAYETSNPNIGKKALNYLIACLTELYEKLVLHYKKKHEMEVNEINNTIDDLKLRKKSEYKNIENINSRMAELKNEIEFISSNTKKLSQERHKFITGNTKEDNILQALLYSNTIQQNLSLNNTYKGEINTFLQQREGIFQKISAFDQKINSAMIKIENITFNKDIINNINVIQQPTFNPNPVKPKIKLRILLAIIAGLFFMMFLAFLIEYIKKEEKK